MQNVDIYLVASLKEAQLLLGPITPNPGPMLPIDDAEIAIDDIKSTPSKDTAIAHMLKINM